MSGSSTTVSMRQGAILREAVSEVRETLGDVFSSLALERAVFGLFFTGVKLSDGHGGVSYTPIKSLPEAVCCPSSARAMPSSGELRGRGVDELLEGLFSGNPLRRTLGIAVLNALSTACLEAGRHEGSLQVGADALDDLDVGEDREVVVVGALAPFLKALKRRARPYTVLELDPSTLRPDELPFYRPAADAAAVVPRADLLVVTGTSLLNDTLEGLLALARPEAEVVVVGPTASMLPGAFFRRGVDVLGGVLVTDPDALLNVIAEAGSGYHFFGRSAERVVIRP